MAADPVRPEDIRFPARGLTQNQDQIYIIESIRIGFMIATLALIIGYQAVQSEFLAVDWVQPVYRLMFTVFVCNFLYLFFIEKSLKSWVPTASLFVLDSIYVTALIYFTGINQSIFLFLYLVNIILCGFIFQRRGAFLLAFFTSILFSILIITGPDLKGQALLFTVGLNNLAFLSVAALSGVLSEQLNFMGSELLAQGRDLRALKDLNNIIIENIATGLMTFDEQGKVLQANLAASEILNEPASLMTGAHIEQILPGLIDRVRRELSGNDRRRNCRFDFTRNVGGSDKIILEVIVSALPTGSLVAGYIMTFHDLTRVRRLEFAMRQSEKMAAIGQLAAGIAHEIRNPLASISGSVQLLSVNSSASGETEDARLMNIVLKEVDRLNGLITEFLDYVRPDVQRMDPIQINQLARSVVEVVKLNKNLRNDTEFEFELKSSSVFLGNPDKIRQALLNIIINALQAMSDTLKPQLHIATTENADIITIKIRDNGSGIDPHNLRKIFEPFHTTKPKGTGLGLAMTHKIIENHGGKIYVESEKGRGTEFTIEIPIRSADHLNLAESRQASDDFSIAFRGQKRGNA